MNSYKFWEAFCKFGRWMHFKNGKRKAQMLKILYKTCSSSSRLCSLRVPLLSHQVSILPLETAGYPQGCGNFTAFYHLCQLTLLYGENKNLYSFQQCTAVAIRLWTRLLAATLLLTLLLIPERGKVGMQIPTASAIPFSILPRLVCHQSSGSWAQPRAKTALQVAKPLKSLEFNMLLSICSTSQHTTVWRVSDSDLV